MNSGDIIDLFMDMILFAWPKNLRLKISRSIQVNQILLKAFESTKGYSKKIIRCLYLFLKYNYNYWKGI